MTDRNQFHYPTPQEMIELEAAAKRARARQIRLMFRKAVRALRLRIAHITAVPAGNRVSHA
ncbi:MAG TPA: hypothetical protein VJO54_15185 [Burkholderiales bacterium]|nr:hypothetical protein [Burkholderiales bacterium]